MLRREININSLLDFVVDDIRHFFDGVGGGFQAMMNKYAKYKVGEVVAIAQSYKDAGFNDFDKTNYPWCALPGWNNKVLTKAGFMPHHIRITNVRVERLQDITDNDCIREGIEVVRVHDVDDIVSAYTFASNKTPFWCVRDAFATLIDKVSGKGTWKSNPYVFVYEFELVD